MNVRTLRNISLADYKRFLAHINCQNKRNKGGHEHYSRADLTRPLTLQNHIDPVPEFIIKNHLRILGMSKEEFFDEFDACN